MKVYGRNSVLERLRANPQSIKKIFVQEGFHDAATIYQKASKLGIAVISIPRSKMMKLARNVNTQGIIADTEGFEYVVLHDVLQEERKRTLVFLDGLNDPQNFGAIIRSLACLGQFAIILPTHDSVSITETVLRVASGGDNYVPIVHVSNLSNSIKTAKEAGYWIAGAVVEGGESILKTHFSYPLGLVVGSEQSGIREVIRRQIDLFVTIPMVVNTMSYNVAHATSILAYEIARQKKKSKNAAADARSSGD